MNEHGKKMLAPIVITVIMVLYVLAEIAVWLWLGLPWYWGLTGCVIGLVIIGLMVGVLVSRIKEIRSGEEDDLSKY